MIQQCPGSFQPPRFIPTSNKLKTNMKLSSSHLCTPEVCEGMKLCSGPTLLTPTPVPYQQLLHVAGTNTVPTACVPAPTLHLSSIVRAITGQTPLIQGYGSPMMLPITHTVTFTQSHILTFLLIVLYLTISAASLHLYPFQ